ncbi:hypothetical protein K6025_02700 [Ehrlichia sp. JZT12]
MKDRKKIAGIVVLALAIIYIIVMLYCEKVFKLSINNVKCIVISCAVFIMSTAFLLLVFCYLDQLRLKEIQLKRDSLLKKAEHCMDEIQETKQSLLKILQEKICFLKNAIDQEHFFKNLLGERINLNILYRDYKIKLEEYCGIIEKNYKFFVECVEEINKDCSSKIFDQDRVTERNRILQELNKHIANKSRYVNVLAMTIKVPLEERAYEHQDLMNCLDCTEVDLHSKDLIDLMEEQTINIKELHDCMQGKAISNRVASIKAESRAVS